MSTEHGHARVEVGNMKFEADMFIVRFDKQPHLSGTPLTQLPTTSDIMGNSPSATGLHAEQGPSLPDGMLMQAGVATLLCPYTGSLDSPQEHPECSAGVCTYSSLMDPIKMMMMGPPRSFIPMLAVKESASVMFETFAGSFDSQTLVPEENAFIAIKITRNYEEWSHQWRDYVPGILQMDQCIVRIEQGTLDNVTQPLLGETPTPYAPGCDINKLQQLIDALHITMETIDQLDANEGRADMEKRVFAVAAFQLRDAWLGCDQLVKSLSTEGLILKTFPGTKECFETPFSSAWLTDPCCNHGASFQQCCVPRSETKSVLGVTGVSQETINQQCNHPGLISQVLEKHVQNVREAESCDERARSMGADWEVVEELKRFMYTCEEELWGKGSSPPTCLVDEDCYTKCDKQTSTCIQPWDNPSSYLLECYPDHIDPILERYWRKDWGLNGALSTDEDFSNEFQTRLFSTSCVGPTSWKYSERWESEQVESCPEQDHNCFCFQNEKSAMRYLLSKSQHPMQKKERYVKLESGPQCWRTYHVPANQTACLEEQQCNYNRDLDEISCTTVNPTSHFCGDCRGGECWEQSSEPVCYTWTQDPQHCVNIGGQVNDPQHPWQCVFSSLSTEEECLPEALCGVRPSLSDATHKDQALGDRWCNSACILNDANSEQECNALNTNIKNIGQEFHSSLVIQINYAHRMLHSKPHNEYWIKRRNTLEKKLEEQEPLWTWWNNDTQTCHTHLWGESCSLRNDTTWFSGRQFRPEMFNTQQRCEEGRCSLDPQMTAAQCTSPEGASCTKRCAQCLPQDHGRTLCYSQHILDPQCANDGGEWNAMHAICVFDLFKTQEQCENNVPQAVWEDCKTKSKEQCSSSSHPLLQCHYDEWAECQNQQACEASGECDDWDYQNWHNPQCWTDANAAKSAACLGVCLMPFNMSRGWPECNYISEQWSQGGCLRYDLNQAGCGTAGGTWKQRAFDQASCEAHGVACDEKRWWQLTPKDQETCIQCGGKVKPYHKWTAGRWLQGEMEPLHWKPRQFESVNRWQPTVDYHKLHVAVERVASQVIAKAMKTSIMCKYNLVAQSLKLLACDCGENSRGDCFENVELVPIGEQEFFSGVENQAVEWSHVSIEVPAQAIPESEDSGIITASSTTLITEGSEKKRRDLNEFETVENHVEYIIGQIIGNMIELTLPESLLEPVHVCLAIDSDIPRNLELYPIPDFAGHNASIPKTWPLGLNVTVVGDWLQVCSDIWESGVYFPIIRFQDWEYVTGTTTPPTTSTTTPPTTSTTTPTTSTTTPPTTSTTTPPTTSTTGLGAGAIIGIIFGSIFGLLLIVLIFSYVTGPPATPYVLQQQLLYPQHKRQRHLKKYYKLRGGE